MGCHTPIYHLACRQRLRLVVLHLTPMPPLDYSRESQYPVAPDRTWSSLHTTLRLLGHTFLKHSTSITVSTQRSQAHLLIIGQYLSSPGYSVYTRRRVFCLGADAR